MIEQDRVPRIPYKLIGNFRVAVFKYPCSTATFLTNVEIVGIVGLYIKVVNRDYLTIE